MTSDVYDAVVVGAGPNGLSAAIRLAQAGRRVLLVEAMPRAGGGMRSEEVTLPGFVHDVCSTVHPMALTSPFFRTLDLAKYGVEWVHAPACLAHAFPDGTAALLERGLDETCRNLGSDGPAWRNLFAPLVERWDELAVDLLRPLRFPAHPLGMARFAIHGVRSADGLLRSKFRGDRARALFAGCASHSLVPLTAAPTAAFGLTLAGAAHAVGWPMVRGGSQRLADALASMFRDLGGEIRTDTHVERLEDLPAARAVILDVTPAQLLRIAGDRLSPRYWRALRRFRYATGVFKMDWALDGPIPWRARECESALTVHVGGTVDEILASEDAVFRGAAPEHPFVLVVQPTRFDSTRAPAGRHVAWAYAHVPLGCTTDMTARIEAQLERYAPGFRDRVLARRSWSPADLEHHNANLVGGDISGGAMTLRQLFFRPAVRWNPYRTSLPGVFLGSSSTPPGGSVHGMCGYYAAQAALGLAMDPPS